MDSVQKPRPPLSRGTFQEDLHCIWLLFLFNPFQVVDVRSHTCPIHASRVRDHTQGNPNTRETCYEQHCIVHVLSILVDKLLHLDTLVVEDCKLGGVPEQVTSELAITLIG